jgi:transposase
MDDIDFADGLAEDALTTGRKSARSQRIEVITRGERRRRWSEEQKREIVVASLRPGVRAGDVARDHGINTGLLYTWRRQMLEGRLGAAVQPLPSFARVEVAAKADQPAVPSLSSGRLRQETAAPGVVSPPAPAGALGLIEIVLPGGINVRVDAAVDSRALRRVLAALEGR